jgi:protein gp37
MGENTKIEWADHTFNPWIGCTRVSPACDHCYAEKLATTRLGVGWGPHAERRRTAESTWRQPLAWNRRAQREGKRARVFCASLADVFDNHPSILPTWRPALWDLIDATPHLDWLLLTKRPQNIAKMLPWPWPNLWLGTTVENQAEADRRIPQLLAAPAAKRFLSCEPLLGPVDLSAVPYPASCERCDCTRHSPRIDALTGSVMHEGRCEGPEAVDCQLDWVIAGGESGPGARPSHPDWFRSLRDQCAAAGVPFFFKQWGDWLPGEFGSPPLVEWQDGAATDRHALPSEGTRRWDDGLAFVAEGEAHAVFRAVGKKAAGALLDGREHREAPHPAASA